VYARTLNLGLRWALMMSAFLAMNVWLPSLLG
jgi:hypothetical protein